MESHINIILRSIVVGLLAVFLTSCKSIKHKPSIDFNEDIEKEVYQSFLGLVDAAKALDTERYFTFLDADKFVGLNADGTTWNSIDDLKAIIVPGFATLKKVESLEFTHVKISVIDQNTAILVNEYQQTVILKDGESVSLAGGGAQVWSNESGRWLLVSISSSFKKI